MTEEAPEQEQPVVAQPKFAGTLKVCGIELKHEGTIGTGVPRDPRITTFGRPDDCARVVLTVRGESIKWEVTVELLGKEYRSSDKDLSVATATVEKAVRRAMTGLSIVSLWLLPAEPDPAPAPSADG